VNEQLRIGCFASGRGSNFEAILQRIQSKELKATISFLITNNSKAGAVEIAKSFQIPVHHISAKTDPDPEAYLSRMEQLVKGERIDLIVLCGYMKPLPDAVIAASKLGAINIHPSLLPKFGGASYYGERVHQAVLEAKEKESGPTVHRVNSVYDSGEVLEQRRVPVFPDDSVESLAARVLEQEHDLYWRVIQKFADGLIGPG